MSQDPLLVVDDDPAARKFVALALRSEAYAVREAADGVEALVACESELPVLVLTDLRMPRLDGLDLLRHLRPRWPSLPVIVLTVAAEVPLVVEAIRLGAANYLVKPATVGAILAAVVKAIAAGGMRKPASEPASEIVGQSLAMVEVRHLIALAARSDVNVLIVGPTGTGKELVARAIHRVGPAGSQPWVAHNCAATPPDLFESEFFGHSRGAFTGAERDHVGLLERADGGVLFLDELECLAPTHQAKLLRVMDDGEFRPVGATGARRTSVRFVAATNREPEELLASGVLREDLYYRLRGFEIRLPPLRDRREDVPLLAASFLGDGRAAFSEEAVEALRSFAWPGNVRQLRNVVRVARALVNGERIERHHLDPELRQPEAAAPPSETPGGEAAANPIRALGRASGLRELERQAILDVLQRHGGNRSRAARELGIDRATLRRKLRQPGIREDG